MSDVPYKVRINRMNIVRALLLLSMPKKVKEALRTRLSENKITWTETFVRLKKVAKWKTNLRLGTLACYENLPIKTHLKKACNLFLRVSPFPQISRFRSLHRLSSNNSENTNHRHLPLTGINHCNSRVSENIHFKRNNHSFQNYNFFSKSKVPIFKSNFGWIVCFL